jgi:predicted Zn-dependent protease
MSNPQFPHPDPYLSTSARPADSSSRVDEGYSEDTRAQTWQDAGTRVVGDHSAVIPLPGYVTNLSEADRSGREQHSGSPRNDLWLI